MIFLAQESASDPLSALLQYGVLGIFAAVLLWLARSLLKREQDRADKVQADNDKLQSYFVDKVIPQMSETTNILKQAVDIMAQILRQKSIEDEIRRRFEEGK